MNALVNTASTSNQTPVRLSQYALMTLERNRDYVRSLVRMTSPTLTAACERAGVPAGYAVLCGGMLASVVDDLVHIGNLRRTDFERTKRKQRVLAAADEPAASALKLAIAASPINGRATVAHWDVVCEQSEVGKLAWLLGMDTETSWGYGRRMERANKHG